MHIALYLAGSIHSISFLHLYLSEAVLEADEAIDAEVYVNKASPLINLVDDWLLQLRYRLTYARVLDANRKFIDAAIRYYELSMSTTTTHSNVRTNSSSTAQYSTVSLTSSLSSDE